MLKDNVRVCNRCERYDGKPYVFQIHRGEKVGGFVLMEAVVDLCDECIIKARAGCLRSVALRPPRAKKPAEATGARGIVGD